MVDHKQFNKLYLDDVTVSTATSHHCNVKCSEVGIEVISYKGHRPSAVFGYRDEDSNSPSTLIFAVAKTVAVIFPLSEVSNRAMTL